ncbi:MAG: gliding motility protein GldL [Cytophagales bacterium]|nr:gliding motility protein GldL [Cytophagales bacterium]
MSIPYRTSHPLSGKDKFYVKIAPVITGVGASVVILGALFKIMHWPGAAPMLIVGLGTEAVLFLLFAFAPPIAEPDWTIVYPDLGEQHSHTQHKVDKKKDDKGSLVKKMDDMLSDANITGETLQKLGTGFNSLTETVNKMGTIASAAVASDEYAQNVKAATSTVQELNKVYSSTVTAMSEMAKSSTDAKEYHTQVQSITKNLSALNAVYEMELQDVNVHLKSMNKFYSSLSAAMENMSEASKDTQSFKSELSKLTGNLSSLNTVYGNMLSAMRA